MAPICDSQSDIEQSVLTCHDCGDTADVITSSDMPLCQDCRVERSDDDPGDIHWYDHDCDTTLVHGRVPAKPTVRVYHTVTCSHCDSDARYEAQKDDGSTINLCLTHVETTSDWRYAKAI
jgi:RNase P subunit RPR2